MTIKKLVPLWPGLLAGILYAVCFFAAFAVWRIWNLLGTLAWAILVSVLLGLLLSGRKRGRTVGRWLLLVAAAAVLVGIGWTLPAFDRYLNLLYRGYHATEAGFAGLFTMFFFCVPTVLIPLFGWLFTKFRTRELE